MAKTRKKTRSDKDKVRIFVVDDHPIVRQGLVELINQQQDLVICGEAEDGPQTLAAIRTQKPDVIIVDISLKETSGMDLIKDISTQYPEVLILTLSMHDESLYAERVLRAGARGYVMKQEATEKVIDAIHEVLRGQVYISDKMATRMVRKLVGSADISGSVIESLSDRELEVFSLIGQGHGTREIAEKLYLSVKTIETYRANIKKKLNLSSAAELLQYAIKWTNDQTSS